jgi:hypothetical protein
MPYVLVIFLRAPTRANPTYYICQVNVLKRDSSAKFLSPPFIGPRFESETSELLESAIALFEPVLGRT